MLPIPLIGASFIADGPLTYSSADFAWYRADGGTASTFTADKNIVTANGSVNMLWDYSGNSRHLYKDPLNGTSLWKSNQRNGLPAFTATASSSAPSWSPTASLPDLVFTESTIIIVGATALCRINTVDSSGCILSYQNNSSRYMQVRVFGSLPNDTHTSYSFTDHGETVTIGTASYSPMLTNYKSNGVGPFGQEFDLTTLGFTGKIVCTIDNNARLFEVMVWDRLLTQSEITQVENYLKNKWAISY